MFKKRICYHCCKETIDGNYCTACGRQIVEKRIPRLALKICKNCNCTTPENTAFCTFCGIMRRDVYKSGTTRLLR